MSESETGTAEWESDDSLVLVKFRGCQGRLRDCVLERQKTKDKKFFYRIEGAVQGLRGLRR